MRAKRCAVGTNLEAAITDVQIDSIRDFAAQATIALENTRRERRARDCQKFGTLNALPARSLGQV
jgi:hypothetical protein